MSPQASDNLEFALTAQRYVAGDLSNVDAQAFEELLAHDEQVCDALAEIVLCAAGLSSATFEPVSVRINESRSSQPPRFALVATLLVSMVLLIAVTTLLPTFSNREHIANRDPISAEPLTNPAIVADLWVSMSDESTRDTVYSEEPEESATDSLYDVPDWLFVAIESEPVDMDEMDSIGTDPLMSGEGGTL